MGRIPNNDPNSPYDTWVGDEPRDGRSGNDGSAGPPGPAGPAGPTGPAGPPGADGVDGADGAPGAAGADGIDGVDGIDGADGAMSLIEAFTFTGAESSKTITIPAGYKGLRFTGLVRSGTASTSTNAGIRFNGDSGANYSGERIQSAGTGLAATGVITQTGLNLLSVSGSTAVAGGAGALDLLIPFPDNTTFHKQMTGQTTNRAANTAAGQVVTSVGGSWLNTAAITSLTFYDIGGANFVAGSQIAVYGIT